MPFNALLHKVTSLHNGDEPDQAAVLVLNQHCNNIESNYDSNERHNDLHLHSLGGNSKVVYTYNTTPKLVQHGKPDVTCSAPHRNTKDSFANARVAVFAAWHSIARYRTVWRSMRERERTAKAS